MSEEKIIARLGSCHGDPIGIDMEAVVGSHICVIANSGGGKSGLLRKALEATSGHIQHIVLDAEDEFYTLREKYDYVIAGGDNGDMPATIAGARKLARAALEHGFSLVAQLNDLGSAGARAFVAEFLEGLLDAPRALWRPVLIAIDEAQRFAPSGAAAESTDAVKDLLFRGRKRGFTAMLASLRITEIDAGVRGMCNNWFLGRPGQTLDQNAMANQLGFSPKEGREMLHGIKKREFFGYGPAISTKPLLFRVEDVETTAVRPGQAKIVTPPAGDDLRAILSGLVAEQKAEPSAEEESSDPPPADDGELRAEIDGCHAQIAKLRGSEDNLQRMLARAEESIATVRKLADQLQAAVAQSQSSVEPEPETVHSAASLPEPAREAQIAPPPAAPAGRADGARLHSAARKMIKKLDQVAPAKLTWSQLATAAGLKASGGHFSAGRRAILDNDMVLVEGEYLQSRAAPKGGMTRLQAFDLWKSVLPNHTARMMDALWVRGAMTREEIGEDIGLKPSGGHFNAGVGQMLQNGVAIERDGKLSLATPLPCENS